MLVKYLYEVKQHQRQHVIYGGHVLGESVHDPAWRKLGKNSSIVVTDNINIALNVDTAPQHS